MSSYPTILVFGPRGAQPGLRTYDGPRTAEAIAAYGRGHAPVRSDARRGAGGDGEL